jgi:hypothetical protein
MSEQLRLFPETSSAPFENEEDHWLLNADDDLNPIDEVFGLSDRLRNSLEYSKLLSFIARFPNYSAFNVFLLYLQDDSSSYVATARTWLRKFRRRPKPDARPLIILAPMAPVIFVYDLHQTEGESVPDALLKPQTVKGMLSGKIYETTLYNCAVQGIAVREISRIPSETAIRITSAVRKRYSDLALEKNAVYLVLVNKDGALADKYAALVYELGHIFCGHLGIDGNAWWPERHRLNIIQEEIEANSASYLTCQNKGLVAASKSNLKNITETNQQLPMFSLNAVFQAVNYIEAMGKLKWTKPKKRSRY